MKILYCSKEKYDHGLLNNSLLLIHNMELRWVYQSGYSLGSDRRRINLQSHIFLDKEEVKREILFYTPLKVEGL